MYSVYSDYIYFGDVFFLNESIIKSVFISSICVFLKTSDLNHVQKAL